jgi:hypothetical protein
MKSKYQDFDKPPRRQKLFYEDFEITVDNDFEESLQEENEDINLNDYE